MTSFFFLLELIFLAILSVHLGSLLGQGVAEDLPRTILAWVIVVIVATIYVTH